MKRRKRLRLQILGLFVVGLWTMMTGFTLLLLTPPHTVNAQDTSTPVAEYIGERECRSCHRDVARDHAGTPHALALQDVSSDKSAILADFTQASDLLTIQLPGEDAPRTLTADDIAYAVGSGRYVQRYLYEVSPTELLVLPVEWNTVDNVWQTLTLADTWPDPAYNWEQNCAGCHTTNYNPDTLKWDDPGVQCEACHGPGSLHADAADAAGGDISDAEMAQITGAIVVSPDAQICGQCHSQGMDSANNRPYPTGYEPGMDLLDSVGYDLYPMSDTTHWWPSGHAKGTNMQFNEWLNSAHSHALVDVRASDYADDSCLECHSTDYSLAQKLTAYGKVGTPAPVTLDSAQSGVSCISCHDPHDTTGADFMLTDTPDNLCASCHNDDNLPNIHHPSVEMFEGQTVIDNVPGVSTTHFAADNGPDCMTCHMSRQPVTDGTRVSHSLRVVEPLQAAPEQPDTCTSCHTDLSRSYAQQFLDKTRTATRVRLENIAAALDGNPPADDWVQKAIDFVVGDGSLGVHNVPYTEALLDAVELQLDIVQSAVPATTPRQIENPVDCSECHADEYRQWEASPHANASLNSNFQEAYARNGRPSYCLRCHASGYDPLTNEYKFEGVVCSNCHSFDPAVGHPPGPVSVPTDSAVCGNCHSGGHASTYDEWLASKHATAGIDCIDCHTPHNNGLVRGDVNSTCADCHAEAMQDQVHMGQDMICTDCHMTPRLNDTTLLVSRTGHTMDIDPGVCAECHGNTHLLSQVGTTSETAQRQLDVLHEQISSLETKADNNLSSGIVGGAVGTLLFLALAFIIIRLGKLR